MKLNNQKILIISTEFWGINQISKHHYALELSKNNMVYFINPPIENTGDNVIRVKKVSNNLHIVTYSIYIRGLNHLPNFVRKYFHYKQASKLMKSIDEIIDIVWSFDPFRFQDLKVFKAKLNIYHAVDVHKTKVEKEVAINADIILATSDKILERFKIIDTPKFKINHGLAGHFQNYKNNQKDNVNNNSVIVKDVNKIKVGYVGNLFYKYLDVKIFMRIIKENADVIFYIIGPYEKSNLIDHERNISFIKFLKDSENVHLLGPKSSNEIPRYINKYDLLLLCYTGDMNIAEMANPHKLLEYLSSGKPIVSHYIDEYRDKRDIVEMVDNNEMIPVKFKSIIENLDFHNSPEKSKLRVEYAKKNTYKKHIKRIEHLISNINR